MESYRKFVTVTMKLVKELFRPVAMKMNT